MSLQKLNLLLNGQKRLARIASLEKKDDHPRKDSRLSRTRAP